MKYQIVIAGIGGVGGYMGGKLAHYYQNNNELEITFIARGVHGQKIARQGLTLITPVGTLRCFPVRCVEDASQVSAIDLLLICVKNYDLEGLLEKAKPALQLDSILIPFQNGMDTRQQILDIIPGATVWNGCIYLVSRVTAPGEVTQSGNFHQIYFGATGEKHKRIKKTEDILGAAGLPIHSSPDIESILWEKFFFLSPLAACTSYLNQPITLILKDASMLQLLNSLLDELELFGKHLGIKVSEELRNKTIKKYAEMPSGACSSMHSDFINEKPTELESLVGYVLKQGKLYGFATPVYQQIYDKLKGKNKTKK